MSSSPNKLVLTETVTLPRMQVNSLQYQKFSADELLCDKKGKRKSEAQKLFQSLLRDAALVVKVWNKAPLLCEIPFHKKEKFFSYVEELAPHLAERRYELWTRLGRMLQNRRRNLNVSQLGKQYKPQTTSSGISPAIFPNLHAIKTEMDCDSTSLHTCAGIPQYMHMDSFGNENGLVSSMQSDPEQVNPLSCTGVVTTDGPAGSDACANSGSDSGDVCVKLESSAGDACNSDYDWQPPSEAEMKLIRARRDRSDKISKLMGDYLLKGYKMLSTVCECGTILLQNRNGEDYCIACSELDSDADKDDPLTNEAAALAQVREQELGMLREGGASPMSSTSDSTQVSPSQRATAPSTTTVKPNTTSSTHVVPQRGADHPALHNEKLFPARDCHSGTDNVDAIGALNKKLSWATKELDRATSVEYSIQLCNLIQSCASAIRALKDL